MSHPRVEEVSDSDVDMSDPSEDDIDDFVESDIMRRVDDSSKPAPPQQSQPQPPRHQHQHLQHSHPQVQMQTTTDEKAYKSYQCLYPVYFDATRTRAEGRRVPRSLAVANPLAIDIVQACAALRLQTVLEAGKIHPKDWANPGRVKVNLRQPPQPSATTVNNKHHLYLLVAQHLRANPTTDQSRSLRMEVRGAPMPPQAQEPGKPWPRPAVPRGWKMGELLPYYSPAMTGGGVSENFLKDMMKEMQGAGAGGPGGMPDMASLLAAAGGGGAGGVGGSGGAGGGGGKREKKGKGK
ncbi:signal recognition particle, SRP19 subunit [Parachaetomium inaequale]|uniref:Signal recognition particle, SRP19 subunit n=1 Tax=Parachaetomium inaequale TaxID=2588326 RepID=A0AAN6P9B5_9PEZI|nr:signal recognition particle, SRP19 subunit [Parachaetomium inaequale]